MREMGLPIVGEPGKGENIWLWEAHMILWHNASLAEGLSLFQFLLKNFTLPALTHTAIENAYDEMELLASTITYSYFGTLQTAERGDIPVKELLAFVGKKKMYDRSFGQHQIRAHRS
ncbi:hypothetical protein [Rufibacter roseus]|uniref:Uncharacterized protein n=1 Tax=Rufibacter roseus TaxID=1567108 RepID=A0ABW2DH70_9BACT|nr:hypothetical protein [Rufibacter roseus]